MDGARSTHGRHNKCVQNFDRKEGDHLEDLDVDGKIILE
jgi:hypothetical protein